MPLWLHSTHGQDATCRKNERYLGQANTAWPKYGKSVSVDYILNKLTARDKAPLHTIGIDTSNWLDTVDSSSTDNLVVTALHG